MLHDDGVIDADGFTNVRIHTTLRGGKDLWIGTQVLGAVLRVTAIAAAWL